MKESFVYPGFEPENIDNNNNHEFDLQTDFSQFLEEAKRHSSHDNETQRTESVKHQHVFINQEAKKRKKSWKTVLFPFWRSSSSNKSKQHSKEILVSRNTNPKPRGYVSGPVYGSGGGTAASSGRFQSRLLGSGPLTGMFQLKKKEEIEIEYVSLNKLNKPLNDDAKVYGPVYLVS